MKLCGARVLSVDQVEGLKSIHTSQPNRGAKAIFGCETEKMVLQQSAKT